ncbi:MAG: NUDIX domain-containing protein [Hymenobacter sp.]
MLAARPARPGVRPEVRVCRCARMVMPETGRSRQPGEESAAPVPSRSSSAPTASSSCLLDWGARGGTLFVGGGRKDGEDAEATARREVAEETGYQEELELVETRVVRQAPLRFDRQGHPALRHRRAALSQAGRESPRREPALSRNTKPGCSSRSG